MWEFSFDGGTLVHNDSFGKDNAGDLAVHRATGCCWVADTVNQELVKLSPTGERLLSVGAATPDGCVSKLGVDESDGSIRGADYALPHVIKYSAAGEEIWRVDVSPPEDIAVYGKDGACWVAHGFDAATRGDLTKLDKDGKTVFTVDTGYGGTGAVAVDQRNGDCWVSATGDVILKYNAAGGKEAAFDADGYVGKMAVSPRDGHLILTYYNTLGERLAEYSATGQKLWNVGLDRGASDVAVNLAGDAIWMCQGNSSVVKYSPTGQKMLTIKPNTSFVARRLSLYY